MHPSVIAVLLLLSSTCGQNPAVQFILTDKGLQYGKDLGTGWIQDQLGLITLPDISGEIPISIFATIAYTLTGTTISKCDFPEPSVEFYEDATGLKTSISGLSVAMTGTWKARAGLIHGTGSFSVAVFSVDVTSVVKLGKDASGRLSVASVGCDAQVGHVDLQVEGDSGWIIQFIVSHYKERIRGEIEDNICPSVEESIVRLEHLLEATGVSFDVDQFVTLEIPLTGLRVVNASSLKLGLKGEFYDTKNQTEPPFEAQPFAVLVQPDYMLSVGLSEFTLNSASYGYYSAGRLQALINDNMIPPCIPLRLNTNSMGPFVPQLPKMLPGLPMILQVYAREAPLFSFQPAVVSLDLLGAIKAFAIQPNGTRIPLFKLNVDSTFSGKMWIAEGKLKGSMGMNTLALTLASSEIGTFKTDAFERLARMGSVVAMIKMNEKLGKGFDVPRMKQAELVSPALMVDKGFLTLSSDVQVFLADRGLN